jgi:hypothetical protein
VLESRRGQQRVDVADEGGKGWMGRRGWMGGGMGRTGWMARGHRESEREDEAEDG